MIRRRRACRVCGFRFSTGEIVLPESASSDAERIVTEIQQHIIHQGGKKFQHRKTPAERIIMEKRKKTAQAARIVKQIKPFTPPIIPNTVLDDQAKRKRDLINSRYEQVPDEDDW